MMLSELLNNLTAFLKRGNEEFEARQILRHVLKMDTTYMLAVRDTYVPDFTQISDCYEIAHKRNEGKPLYQILGDAEFYSLDFKVTEDTLIPRADTELIVDLALDIAKNEKIYRAVDLCSGTGCIGIAFAKNTNIPTDCVEYYANTHSVLCENVQMHNDCVQPFLADACTFNLDDYQLVMCNPPYIAQSERDMLDLEVLNEPQYALFAEDDGLEFYKKISKNVKSGAFVVFEIGYKQAQSVTEILENEGYKNIQVHRDLCGNDRAVTAQKI